VTDNDVNVAFLDWRGFEFKYITTHFPGSMWVELDFNEKKGWGRAWINPTMDMTAFNNFFEQKGYVLNYLKKGLWAEEAD